MVSTAFKIPVSTGPGLLMRGYFSSPIPVKMEVYVRCFDDCFTVQLGQSCCSKCNPRGDCYQKMELYRITYLYLCSFRSNAAVTSLLVSCAHCFYCNYLGLNSFFEATR